MEAGIAGLNTFHSSVLEVEDGAGIPIWTAKVPTPKETRGVVSCET